MRFGARPNPSIERTSGVGKSSLYARREALSISQVKHLKPMSFRSSDALFYAPLPNLAFNSDAKAGYAFGIFMASLGALRPAGLRRRLTV